MRFTKSEWLGRYGACEALDNTPENFARLEATITEYPAIPDDDCNRCGKRHCVAVRTDELDHQGNVVASSGEDK